MEIKDMILKGHLVIFQDMHRHKNLCLDTGD